MMQYKMVYRKKYKASSQAAATRRAAATWWRVATPFPASVVRFGFVSVCYIYIAMFSLSILYSASFAFNNSLYFQLDSWTDVPSVNSTETEQTEQTLPPTNQTFVVVVACTRSLPGWKSINDTSAHSLLLPSVLRTSHGERDDVRLEVLLAFDVGDSFWENDKNRQDLRKTHNQIAINYISVPKTRSHHIPFNEACRAAYEYGADFIVRVNDDSEFVTNGWITHGMNTLQSYKPPHVGMVGPTCHEGNNAIMTHDMVHRTHLDIFADYYPDEFDNWWIDDWISLVYGKNRTTKLPIWVVKHHLGEHRTRYKVDWTQRKLLSRLLDRGRRQIAEYLHNETHDPNTYRVMGNSKRVVLVDGPIAAHLDTSTQMM
jgi:hypothetical protein